MQEIERRGIMSAIDFDHPGATGVLMLAPWKDKKVLKNTLQDLGASTKPRKI